MNNFTYSIPTKIHFGKGQISHLSELSESGNKVLLCYGGGSIKKAGSYYTKMDQESIANLQCPDIISHRIRDG